MKMENCDQESIEILEHLPLSNDSENTEIQIQETLLAARSCFMSQNAWPRSWCIKLANCPWFDRLSMVVIVVSCICMAMYEPCDSDNCHSRQCKILKIVEHLVLVYFTIEMAIKMVAYGLLGKNCYFTVSWNRLDFIIVMAGFIQYFLESHLGHQKYLKVLRLIRVLRPLRAVNRLASVKMIVTLLFDTLPLLADVILLCGVTLFLCGIIGVQLWGGVFRNRCFIGNETIGKMVQEEFKLPGYYGQEDRDDEYICSIETNGMHTCEHLEPYDICSINLANQQNFQYWHLFELQNQSNLCQLYDTCIPSGPNPFQGALNFDNILYAFLTIFVVTSKEGWVDVMYYTQDAVSFWAWIYYGVLILVGAIFMVNLFLVVMSMQFTELKRREQKRLRTILDLNALIKAANEAPGIYDVLHSSIASHLSRIRNRFFPQEKHDQRNLSAAERWFGGAILLSQFHQSNLDKATQTSRIPGCFDKYHQRFHRFVRSKLLRYIVITAILLNAFTLSLDHYGQVQLNKIFV